MTTVKPTLSDGAAPPAPAAAASAATAPQSRARWSGQAIRSVHRWTDALLSFRISRGASFRFVPGQYARLGLVAADGSLVWRPFSMVSAPDDPELEFVATLVPGGAFSGLLGAAEPGSDILLDDASFGFLTVDRVAPGRDLWMLASGTGLGPFVSMLRDPATWSAFETLVLVHSVRHAADLAYRAEIEQLVEGGPPRSGQAPTGASARLRYAPVVTREPVPGALAQRIPRLLERGTLEQAVGLALQTEPSRILVCGNPEMSAELRRLLVARGFSTPRRGLSGQMAFENYW